MRLTWFDTKSDGVLYLLRGRQCKAAVFPRADGFHVVVYDNRRSEYGWLRIDGRFASRRKAMNAATRLVRAL